MLYLLGLFGLVDVRFTAVWINEMPSNYFVKFTFGASLVQNSLLPQVHGWGYCVMSKAWWGCQRGTTGKAQNNGFTIGVNKNTCFFVSASDTLVQHFHLDHSPRSEQGRLHLYKDHTSEAHPAMSHRGRWPFLALVVGDRLYDVVVAFWSKGHIFLRVWNSINYSGWQYLQWIHIYAIHCVGLPTIHVLSMWKF